MNEGPVDWGSAILIGGMAGWMANKFMHAHAHLIVDVVAGVAGAVLLNAMFEGLGFHYGGWVEFLALGFVERACCWRRSGGCACACASRARRTTGERHGQGWWRR